jgi:hypothetical protein
MNNKTLKEMIIDEIKCCENRRRDAFVRMREAEAVLNLYDAQKIVLEELLEKAEEMEAEAE